jgi:hypothetical protein
MGDLGRWRAPNALRLWWFPGQFADSAEERRLPLSNGVVVDDGQ